MRSKKKTLSIVSIASASLLSLLAVLSVGCSSSSDNNNNNPPPPTKTTYSGTLYMATEMGGHVAIIPVTIDPSNATTPITIDVANVTTKQLASGFGTSNKTHIFHDVRLDATANRLYYSAIFSDTTGSNDGKVHLGYLDLANNNTIHDAMIDATAAATAPGMAYCGSGQTSTHFVPMTMSYPAYIDAIPKAAISGSLTAGTGGVVRTFIDDFRTNGDYIFSHGVVSPDGSNLYVAVNETDATYGGIAAHMKGSITGYLLPVSKITAGGVTSADVAATNTVSGLGTGGTTIAFRSTFTPDGKKILQAGCDRVIVLDALNNLSLVQQDTSIGGSFTSVENHDVMPTPDGKYALLALRFKHDPAQHQDSGIQLYDIANNKTIGAPVSTCNKCHDAVDAGRLTCGLEGKLTVHTQ